MDLDKCKGCLIGGAIGDALGYPVEFLRADEIFDKYGPDGIQEFHLSKGKALISDDTQMTLFTASGLLQCSDRVGEDGIMDQCRTFVRLAYLKWLETQEGSDDFHGNHEHSWLMDIPELYNLRAPGTTCLSALEEGGQGTVENPLNTSKGCGGVMRVAPVGLFLPKFCEDIKLVDAAGAEMAAITHGHSLGYIPAAALVHIIAGCVFSEDSLEDIVWDAVETIDELYSDDAHIDEFHNIMDKAVELAHMDMDDLEAIGKLGEGWVAEETLAIAVYCCLKYEDDFESAVVAAVNHDGDSDSTGAVTGNILGAYLGYNEIPEKYIDNLELKDVILKMAEVLYNK